MARLGSGHNVATTEASRGSGLQLGAARKWKSPVGRAISSRVCWLQPLTSVLLAARIFVAPVFAKNLPGCGFGTCARKAHGFVVVMNAS
ncbi:MAG: hypothetical protein KGK16_15960 [Bradyrhizobium sp.]|nr:hypothetical protein [Bradyrhizobium sp.]